MATQLWGTVSFNSRQGAWCLRGTWQGQRLYFSEYYTAIGPKTCATEQEALMLQSFISNEIANGTFDPRRYKKTRPVHLKKYAARWLETIRPTIKYATFRAYRAAFDNWILPTIGDVFLADLNYGHYLKLWTEVPRSEKYRKNILTTLYAMLEDARRSGDIRQVPEKIVFRGKFSIPSKDPEWIDRPTQHRILEHIPERHRPIFQFIIVTGVRPSEARALMKKDVYAELGYIAIRHTFAPVPGGEAVKEVKQKKERRIPYYDSLGETFASVMPSLSEFVFVNPETGRPYSKNINRIWNSACKKVGITISLNNAGRHSWGNQMAAKGVDFEIISKGLGHSTTAITKAHYADPNMDVLKQAVDGGKIVKLRAAKNE